MVTKCVICFVVGFCMGMSGYGGGHTSGGSGGAGGDGAGETGQPPQKELWPMIFEKAWAKLHGESSI